MKPTHHPSLITCFASAISFFVMLALCPAQAADDGQATRRQIESTLGAIDSKMNTWADDYRNKGVLPPPDLSRELTTLQRYVDHYIAKYEPTTAGINNPLKQLLAEQSALFADDAKALARASKNIDMLTDVYEQIWRKHRRAHKLTAVLLTGKGMVDVLGLVAVFDKTFWPIGASFFTSMATDFQTGKWKTRGDLLVGGKSMELVTRNLRKKHLELKQELEAVPRDLDEAIVRTGKVRYLSKDCWDLAKTLQKEINDRKAAVELRNRNIATVLTATSKKINQILAKRAQLRQCIIDPSPVVLAAVGDRRGVTVTKIYDSGLHKKAAAAEVTFTYDIPRVVTFSPVANDIVANAVAVGKSEVKITVTEGNRQANARVTVEVGGAGTQPKTTPPKVQVPPKATQPGVPTTHGKPVIGISITSASGRFLPNMPITFTRNVSNTNPHNQYTFSWILDGRPVPAAASFDRKFIKPGRHSVQLVMNSSDPSENDTITRSFDVEYPPEVKATIEFVPETNIYEVGATVGLLAKVENAEAVTEYRWYVNGDYVGSGASGVEHKFDKAGDYQVKLGLRMGSNFDELTTTRTLTIGEAKIGTLGRWRNRFEASGAPDNLVVRSSYWVGGDARWSKPIAFAGGSIGPVEHYLLYTGEQADGWNTGYLVYVPRGTTRLQFKVFHFRWPKNPKLGPPPQGFVHYSGELPRHAGKTPIPNTIRFTKKASRLCDVAWRTKDGSECTARISKFKPSKTIRYSGVDDLGCKKVAVKADEGDLPRVLLKTNRGDITIELFEDQAPNTVANFVSLVERGFYNGLTFHRVLKDFMVLGGCPKGDGTGGPGYRIACESARPNAQKHVRGAVSLARGQPDTGGSQFFIMLSARPQLDGAYTVFGQVIDGMDVVSRLQKQDTITKAEVLRKRAHPYEPKTLPQ